MIRQDFWLKEFSALEIRISSGAPSSTVHCSGRRLKMSLPSRTSGHAPRFQLMRCLILTCVVAAHAVAGKSLANALTGNDQLQKRLENTISDLKSDPDAIVLVTDLEALHPYLRIGAIEAQLQGKFHIPTIFFYPGVRTGKTRLRFLGFYPEDGNYRSVHVGG